MEEQTKVKWKKCPSCDGFIPEDWTKHDKCGWNVEVTKENKESNGYHLTEENIRSNALRCAIEYWGIQPPVIKLKETTLEFEKYIRGE